MTAASKRHDSAGDERALVAEFHALVNMTPRALEAWLQTDESHDAGWTRGGGESVGHASGRRIIRILRKARGAYTAADLQHMRTVIGFIKRHTAQGGPAHDREHSRWAASLKNWGHDPLKGRARARSAR